MPGHGGLRRFWSADAALRALRTTIVVPSLLALTFEVIGNGQMALFAVFGSFAALIFSSFGGTRRDKAIAYLGLALAGTVAIVIGSAVSGITWLAVLVTIPVAFAIFTGGVAGPNSASGVTGALLAYVLPVASPGGAATIPSRLAGWWLACAVSTAAVMLLSRRPAGDRLRRATAAFACALADHLTAAADGVAARRHREATIAARQAMIAQWFATPYRPTGLAIVDQALGNLIHVLEWCSSLACDTQCPQAQGAELRGTSPSGTGLLAVSADVLRQVAGIMTDHHAPLPDITGLERCQQASLADQDQDVVQAAHAQSISVAVRAAAADAMIASRRADPKIVAEKRMSWYGATTPLPSSPLALLAGAIKPALPHASLRSVWFRSAIRGSLALAIAVAAADLSGVQHGFWVVLGTLSVLRSNAVSTGATALRALAGTAAGFAIGAALLLAIGTGPPALWTALPVAVLIAAYAPGVLPFAVGQAGFTVTVLVLFNLLVPVGWTVGLLRVEDVAIGCAVSLVVGALFWPHGASTVVGDDLAAAFRNGAAYLTQSVNWALGLADRRPDAAVPTATAGIMLDDAMRGYLAEQGAKRLTKDELWSLVMATTRLRLTSYTVAGLPGSARPGEAGAPARSALTGYAGQLAGFYQQIAVQVGRPGPDGERQPGLVQPPPPDSWRAGLDGSHPQAAWVSDHLHHLGEHAPAVTGPALHLAEQRRGPWWR